MKPDPKQHDPAIAPAEAELQAQREAQIDAELDATLLDEALAEPAPQSLESLQQEILALTDPQMLSLLDEALKPEVPSQLADRIIAATSTGKIIRPAAEQEAPAVIGRISPNTWRYAAAAAIALAVGLSVWFTSQPDNSPKPHIADSTTQPESTDIDKLEFEQQTAIFADATDEIESEIQALSDGLDKSNIDQDTIWADMDAYEQFLDDIESDLG